LLKFIWKKQGPKVLAFDEFKDIKIQRTLFPWQRIFSGTKQAPTSGMKHTGTYRTGVVPYWVVSYRNETYGDITYWDVSY
jgi:hypothetical protein